MRKSPRIETILDKPFNLPSWAVSLLLCACEVVGLCLEAVYEKCVSFNTGTASLQGDALTVRTMREPRQNILFCWCFLMGWQIACRLEMTFLFHYIFLIPVCMFCWFLPFVVVAVKHMYWTIICYMHVHFTLLCCWLGMAMTLSCLVLF